MAKTFGYGLQAFAGGFQTGLGLRTERMIADEKKRAGKLAEEKEENALNWLTSNKNSLMNIYTLSQEERSKLLFESAMYKKEWTDYIRDVENFIQDGDLEGLKHLNDMEEEKIKAERDMLPLGIRPENAFIGKYYSEESMNYAKKLQMGKLTNKPIGTKMYEEEFGKLPPEVKTPTAADRKLDFAIKHYNLPEGNPEKISFDTLLRFFGVDVTTEEAKGLEKRVQDIETEGKKAGIPQNQIDTAIKNEIVGKPMQTPEEEMKEYYQKQFGTFKRNLLSGINDLGFIISPENRDKYLSITFEEYMQFMQGEIPERFKDDITVTDKTTGKKQSTKGETIADKLLEKLGLQKIPVEEVGGALGETVSPTEVQPEATEQIPEILTPEIPTPKVPAGSKEAMIPLMSKQELEDAMEGLDPSDPMYKIIYDVAVERGYIKK